MEATPSSTAWANEFDAGQRQQQQPWVDDFVSQAQQQQPGMVAGGSATEWGEEFARGVADLKLGTGEEGEMEVRGMGWARGRMVR